MRLPAPPPAQLPNQTREFLSLDMVNLSFYVFLFWSILLYLDPLYFGYGAFRVTRDIGPLKYIGLSFGVLGGLFALAAILFRERRMPAELTQALRLGIPLYCFAMFVLIGSGYARFANGFQESFLSVSFATLGFPLAILFFHGCRHGARVVSTFFRVLLAACGYIVPVIVLKRMEGGQAFHTEIFLVIPLSVYFFLTTKSRLLAWGMLFLLVATAFALHKNLGYTMVVGSLFYLYFIHRSRSPATRPLIVRYIVIYFLIVCALLVAALLAFLLAHREEYLPSGNVEVRFEVYGYAFSKFLSSPIWGDLFTDSSLVYLSGREVLGRTHVTTHSDWLDVLSHGGLVGMAMYMLTYLFPLRRAFAVLRRAPPSPEIDALHGLLAIATGGIFVSLFVSLFLALPVAVLFWFNLGLLSALTVRIESSIGPTNSGSLGGAHSYTCCLPIKSAWK